MCNTIVIGHNAGRCVCVCVYTQHTYVYTARVCVHNTYHENRERIIGTHMLLLVKKKRCEHVDTFHHVDTLHHVDTFIMCIHSSCVYIHQGTQGPWWRVGISPHNGGGLAANAHTCVAACVGCLCCALGVYAHTPCVYISKCRSYVITLTLGTQIHCPCLLHQFLCEYT